MKTNLNNELKIERPADPAHYFANHADELAAAGADAFGQSVEDFAPQVKERFERASLAQVFHYAGRIAGFALYDMIRGQHWRLAFYRG